MTGQLVSVGGVLLAAYGFFYNQVADTLHTALETGTDILDTSAKKTARATVEKGLLRGALPLTLTASLFTIILLPHAVEIIGGMDVAADYDAVRAAYVVVTLFWLGLTALMVRNAAVLLAKRSRLG